jgi:mersacidin/lichenicidin family type 2 lantibiotic
MSTNDIIRTWKAGDEDKDAPKNPANAPKNPANAPKNPAGEEELSDEELKKAAGGLARSNSWNRGGPCGPQSADVLICGTDDGC